MNEGMHTDWIEKSDEAEWWTVKFQRAEFPKEEEETAEKGERERQKSESRHQAREREREREIKWKLDVRHVCNLQRNKKERKKRGVVGFHTCPSETKRKEKRREEIEIDYADNNEGKLKKVKGVELQKKKSTIGDQCGEETQRDG